jgi:uncharacterized protein (TIGR00156 family)
MTIKSKSAALLISATAILMYTPGAAQAQYTGPSAQVTANSVADILKNPVDDQPVMLRGFLVRQVGNEKYMFSDGTGEIRVDIDAKRFAGQQIDAKTKVEIRGEVEKDFLQSPEVDVDTILIIR